MHEHNLYETIDRDKHVENEYVAIKTISEGVTQKDDPIYSNTSLCSGLSERNDELATREYQDPKQNHPDENSRVTTMSKCLLETATALRRLHFICIILGVTLVISAVTIGVLLLKMKERIDKAEQTSEQRAMEILAFEKEQNASRVVMQEHSTRMEKLELASVDSSSLIQNHTDELFVIKKNQTVNRADMQVLMYGIQEIEKANKDINNVLKDYYTTLEKTGFQIGFTAQGRTLTSSGVLSFTTVKSNYGSGYNSSTGIFICSYPGLYFFALSLIKRRASDEPDLVSCNIRKNTMSLIQTRIDPNDKYADYGSYGTSTSILVHLSNGDRVYVGGCSSQDTIDYLSTFSGFLLKAD